VNRILEAFAWQHRFKMTPEIRILTTEAAKEWVELAHEMKAPVSGDSGNAADDSISNDVLRQRIAELEGETLRLKAEISELHGPEADEEEDETEGYRVAWLSRADAAVELARTNLPGRTVPQAPGGATSSCSKGLEFHGVTEL
jgi:hypothetical protein